MLQQTSPTKKVLSPSLYENKDGMMDLHLRLRETQEQLDMERRGAEDRVHELLDLNKYNLCAFLAANYWQTTRDADQLLEKQVRDDPCKVQ